MWLKGADILTQKKKTLFKFIFPSLLGVFLFLIPLNYNGNSELAVGIMGSWLKKIMGAALIPAVVIITVLSALITVIHKIKPIPFIKKNKKLDELFSPDMFWFCVRIIGAVFAIIAYFHFGTKVIWSSDTGGNVLESILPTCMTWYLIGGFFLPLLTDYGLMDILSSVFTKFARKLFCVPGRAMIDCITSWMGSSVCGAYLTISQYESGIYNAKEASIILCNFSLLSVSLCSLIASMVGVGEMFGKFYLTIVIAGILCAIIMPRLWPISKFPEQYDKISGNRAPAEKHEGISGIKWGYIQACKRAESAPGFKSFFSKGAYSALNLTVSTLPCIMAFGTVALIVATYTPVFEYLGLPLGYYIGLFGIPEATQAGSAVLVGFADQFIPVIIGGSMQAVETRFLIGCISILQIVYITDIGTLILTSRVPIKLWHLFVIFLERVIISIPIVVVCMRIFGIM